MQETGDDEDEGILKELVNKPKQVAKLQTGAQTAKMRDSNVVRENERKQIWIIRNVNLVESEETEQLSLILTQNAENIKTSRIK